jgi:hypothetical protein
VNSTNSTELEALLRRALRPVEPPTDLALRLEETLTSLTELAQDELDNWEVAAMRDPRNWVRPAAATVVGVSAGSALVVLRVRRNHRRRRAAASDIVDLAGRTLRDIGAEARKVFDR